MENEIIAKENGFIYKGNFYDKGDLLIADAYFLVSVETGKEYGLFLCNYKDIPKEETYKIIKKYEVRKGFNSLETFDTEDEAKDALKDCADWFRPNGTGEIWFKEFGLDGKLTLIYKNR